MSGSLRFPHVTTLPPSAGPGYKDPVRKTLLLLAALLIPILPTAAGTVTRQRADELLAKLPEDPWLATQDASTLAWLEAPNLHAMVDLYEATGNTKYLDELVRRADQAISHRDDRRDVADATGKVHKCWSMASKYTVAEATLAGPDGRAVIKLRSIPYANNQLTRVRVVTHDDGRFDLLVTNPQWKRDESFTNLTAAPTGDRYFPRVINAPRTTPNPPHGTCTEHSLLLRAEPIGDSPAVPAAQDLKLTPLPLSYGGYVGIIYYPMLRFADLVRRDPNLKTYLPAADRLVRAAEESYSDAWSLWRNGPKEDEGYYLLCERGGAFPWDNLPEPFNYLGGHVCSELLLFKLTGNPAYRDHAERMARLFKRRLDLRDGDLYVWHYWYEPVTTTGWTRETSPSDNVPEFAATARIEDVSHGTLDVQLALSAAAAGIEFDAADLRRFVNTFLANVVDKDGTGFNSLVSGAGGPNPTRVFGWLPLAAVDRRVYDACRRVYEARAEDHLPSLARLLKWEKGVGQVGSGMNNRGARGN